MTSPARDWVLDLVIRDRRVVLVVSEPVSGMVELEPILGWSHADAVTALRAIMVRVESDRPHTIITDHGQFFAGLGKALGLDQQFVTFTDQRRAERLRKVQP